MENPTESIKTYDKNYYLSFHDGSLSKKLLEFSSYIKRNILDEDEIDRRISQRLYNYPSSQKPSYYQENPELFSSYLHSAMGIKKIEIIKNELSICFLKLCNWSNKNNLEILDENHEKTGVDDQFIIFLNRIKNNDFSYKTYLFYGDGKKAIETIALLIEDNSIDKNYRINRLIELTLNGNLNYCVEGCFSRFMSTAQYLKNFLNFNFPYILTKLITDIAEKISSSKHNSGAKIYTEILCEIVKVSPRDYEIHAKNYLINNLMEELGLTQKKVDDFYTHIFDNQHTKQIFNYFLSVFKSKFTSTAIVKFLQNEYFERESIYFNDGQSNIISTEKLEEFLILFGQDNDFQLNEIITLDTNEKPKFRIDNPLLITLAERLINTEWFRFGFYSRWIDKYGSLLKPLENYNVKVEMPLLNEMKLKYRIFIGNFELSWFKLNTERHRIIDLIKSENNLYDLLNENISNNMVQYLFENLNDLLEFIKILPKKEHATFLSYLDKNRFNFKFHILSNFVFNEVINQLQAHLNYYDLLIYFNELFSNIEKENLIDFSLRFQISDLIKNVMDYNIKYFDTGNTYFVNSFLNFIKFANLIGYKKFLDLNFDLNPNLDKDLYKLNKQLYFESTFKNIRFNLELSDIEFKKTDLINVNFKNKIDNIIFSTCKIIAKFDSIEKSLISQVKGDIDILYCKDLKINNFFGNLHFSFADSLEIGLTTVKKITIRNIKDAFFFNVKFDQIIINGEILNTYFSMMDFTNTRFIPLENIRERIVGNIFTGNFNFRIHKNDKQKMFFFKSLFSTESLIDFLNYPAISNLGYDLLFFLKGTDLRLVNFNNILLHSVLEKYKKIDLGHCNLEGVTLKNLLSTAEIDLTNANLKKTIFLDANTFKTNFNNADLSNCDLSKAIIINSKINNAKIENTQLTIAQLFYLYKQGHYDFSSIILTGIYDLQMGQSLEGSRVSNQAFGYLINHGYKNFRRFDLRFLSQDNQKTLQARSDLNFEGAIFDQDLLIPECIIRKNIVKRSLICFSYFEDINKLFDTLIITKEQKKYIDPRQWEVEYKKANLEQKQHLIKVARIVPLYNGKNSFVDKLLHSEDLKLFLKDIAYAVNQINLGILETETILNFIEGNYQKTFINLAFITSGPLLSKISKKILNLGDLNVLKGRFFLGHTLRMSSPFLSKANSFFVLYDFVKEIKQMNSSDIISLLHVIDDNIYLTIDATELGLETAEILGFVEEGLSSTFAIPGSISATIIFISTNAYEAVDYVDKLNKFLTLTPYEKTYEGLRAFFGLGLDNALKSEIEKKQINNFLSLQAIAFLKQSLVIKNYFFSTIDKNTDYINNTIVLSAMHRVGFNRAKPDIPPDAILICYNSEISTDASLGYYCLNTIGISDVKIKHENLTLINIGKGNDIVEGFLNYPNIIVTEAGYKLIKGGNREDMFFLVNDGITGSFHGLNDIDTIDLSKFVPELDILEIDLLNNYLINNDTILIYSIEKILSRTNKADKIIANCETVAIDSKGGNFLIRDFILFNDLDCKYSTFIKISDFTMVTNLADSGNFTYFISRNNDGSNIEMLNKASNLIFFNNSLSELNEIQFIQNEKNFGEVIFYFKKDNFDDYFKDGNVNELSLIFIKFNWNNIKFYMNDKTEIKINRNHLLIFVKETFFSSIELALANYLKKAIWLRASIIVNSDSHLFFISLNNNEVLENNPELTTYLVSIGAQNIFRIFLSQNLLNTSSIYIHNLNNIDAEDILDLRDITKTIKHNFNCEISLNVQDLNSDLNLIINLDEECSLPEKSLLNITLVGSVNKWYSKINILKNTLFLNIYKTNISNEKLSWSILPQSIDINETKKILIMSDDDIEPNTLIKLPIPIENLSPVRIDNNDLDLALVSIEKEFYAVVFLKFYKNKSKHKYSNLTIQYNEEKINFIKYVNTSQNLLPCLSNILNKIDNNIAGMLTLNRRKRQTSFLDYQKNRKDTFFSNSFQNQRKPYIVGSQELERLSTYNTKITIDVFIPISAFIYGSLSSILDEIIINTRGKSNCIESIYLHILKPIVYLYPIIDDNTYWNLLIYLVLHFSFIPFPNFQCESYIGRCANKSLNFLLPILLYLFAFNPLLIFYENGFTDFCFSFLNLLYYSTAFKSGEFLTTKLIKRATKFLNNSNFNNYKFKSSFFSFEKEANKEFNIDLALNDDETDISLKENIKFRI